MTRLLELKETIVHYYMKFERAIVPIGKFILYFIMLFMINTFFGLQTTMILIFVMILFAAINIYLPGNWVVLVFIGFISYRFMQVSVEATILLTVSMFVIYLLFIRVFPNMAYFVVITPVMFVLKIGYAVPIFAGLFFGPIAIIPVCIGALVYKFSAYIPGLLKLQSESVYDMPETLLIMYKYMVNTFIQDTSIILTMIIFAAVLLVTYIVSKLEYDYVWYIAIGAGTTVSMLGFIVGTLILKSDISILSVLFGSVLGGLICMVAQFMRFSLDYPRTERVQFEDETYYYFVKAVPKVRITKTEKAITKIK